MKLPVKLQGVSPDQILFIRATIERLLPGAKVLVFGSRVSGQARQYSDLDLALDFSGKTIPMETIAAIRDCFEESDLPFQVDLVDFATVSADFSKIIAQSAKEL